MSKTRKEIYYKASVLSILLFSGFLFTSCSLPNLSFLKKKEEPIKEVNLSMWGLWETSEIVTSSLDQYKEQAPNVSVAYEQRSFRNLLEYKDTLMTRLSENTAPDVFLAHVSWLPQIGQYLGSSPASGYTKDEFSSTFYPVSETYCVSNNVVFCVPQHHDGLALLYNVVKFQEAGITRPPVSWEEFRQYATKLTKKDETGKILISGAAIGTSRNVAFSSDILGLMFAQSLVSVPEDMGTKAAADALTFYAGFSKEDKIWDNSMPYSPISFSQGKVAMIFAPSWVLLNVKSENPSLNVASAPVPQVPIEGGSGYTNANWGSFWVYAVPKSSQNLEDSWKLIKHLTSKDVQMSQYSVQSQYRPFGEIYSRKDLKDSLSNHELLAPYVLGAETANTYVIADRSGNDPFVEAINTAIDAAAKGGNSNNALGTAKVTIESLLSPVK